MFFLALDSMNLAFARSNLDILPTFKRLINDGSFRPLETTANVASASVWPTFCAGVHPGGHGHYFPFQWDPTTMSFRRTDRPSWAKQFEFDPFWFGLAAKGFKCVIFDAAQINPRQEVPCVQIINWSYQSSGAAFSNPPELLKELRRRFGHRPIGPEVPVPKKRGRMRVIRDQLLRATKAKADAIIWLAESQEWDFFLAAMYELHRAGHNLWPVSAEYASDAEPDAMLDIYVETDRQVGRILDRINSRSTTVVIFALNGMEANRVQNHFLPEILSRLNAVYLSHGDEIRRRTQRVNLVGHLRKLVPYGLQFWAAHLLGENVQDWVVNRTMIGGIDWARTPAFALSSGGEGFIRLNLKGREREGCLAPEEVDGYTNWLKQEMTRFCVAGTGEPLVSSVIDLQKQFSGPRAHLLPDLAVQWAPREPATRIQSPTVGEIEARLQTGRGGNHTCDSFALFYGDTVPEDGAPSVRRIEDLGRLPGYWLN